MVQFILLLYRFIEGGQFNSKFIKYEMGFYVYFQILCLHWQIALAFETPEENQGNGRWGRCWS